MSLPPSGGSFVSSNVVNGSCGFSENTHPICCFQKTTLHWGILQSQTGKTCNLCRLVLCPGRCFFMHYTTLCLSLQTRGNKLILLTGQFLIEPSQGFWNPMGITLPLSMFMVTHHLLVEGHNACWSTHPWWTTSLMACQNVLKVAHVHVGITILLFSLFLWLCKYKKSTAFRIKELTLKIRINKT